MLEPIYNGVNDRVGQTVGTTTTHFALDVAGGLPEVIFTSENNAYLHLPGVIMAERNTGEVRYLLSDGLGSVRQAVDETGAVVSYHEFDPYGQPVLGGGALYGFTGEWWEAEMGLLHLRARWYAPEMGAFLSVDPVESEPPYQYVGGNPINAVDPSGRSVDPPGPTKLSKIYCYNQEQNRLTLSSNRFAACATNAVVSRENRSAILTKVNRIQPNLPTNRLWVEMDKAWHFSVYVTLDVDKEFGLKNP